jgi:trk system potassium uptake protein TrkH
MSIAGLDLMTSFSAALTTLGNTGPGFGLIGPTENFAGIPYFAKWVQIFLMEIGRLEVITVVIIFTRSFWKQ